jgi:hypothetical protein
VNVCRASVCAHVCITHYVCSASVRVHGWKVLKLSTLELKTYNMIIIILLNAFDYGLKGG